MKKKNSNFLNFQMEGHVHLNLYKKVILSQARQLERVKEKIILHPISQNRISNCKMLI